MPNEGVLRVDRHLSRSEFERALELADDLAVRRLDQRSRSALGQLARR
jgi:hypothetical protein